MKKLLLLSALSLTLVLAGCNTAPVVEEEEETPVVEEEEPAMEEEEAEEAAFEVGDQVFAEWTPNNWFLGEIEGTCEEGFNVAYDDGNEKCHAEDEIILDEVPEASEIEVGSAVIADWSGAQYYNAEVTAIEGEMYSLKYYDNFTKDVKIDDLRLDPR